MCLYNILELHPTLKNHWHNVLKNHPFTLLSLINHSILKCKSSKWISKYDFWTLEITVWKHNITDSQFLYWPNADNLYQRINTDTSQLPKQQMIQLSMNGPNTNWKVFEKFSTAINPIKSLIVRASLCLSPDHILNRKFSVLTFEQLVDKIFRLKYISSIEADAAKLEFPSFIHVQKSCEKFGKFNKFNDSLDLFLGEFILPKKDEFKNF